MEDLSQIGKEIRDVERKYKKEIEPYRTELWSYCYRLTGSPWDAEDLVQETLLKSLSVLGKLFQPVETKAYLFRIATNHWIDQLRRTQITQLPLKEFIIQEKASEFEYMVYENLEVLVQELSPIQYVALILSEGFGFKAQEVSQIIGTSEGAIHTGLSRARSILRKNRASNSIQPNYVGNLEADKVIEKLLEGFHNKDPDVIASLLDKHITVDIIHSGIEHGIEEVKRNSLKDWEEIADGQLQIETRYISLWGRPTIVELERKSDGHLYLSNVHFVEVEAGRVIMWRMYCFSYDLMKLAAESLHVKLNAAYFYHIF